MTAKTFGDNALQFFKEVELPETSSEDIVPINIYDDAGVRSLLKLFFDKFFSDTKKRILVLGINPGRFGSGVTGIPFTDPISLSETCGIENVLPDRREVTSQFVYTFIEQFGGAKQFYKDFFMSAVSPIGFTKSGLNYNYYDDKKLYAHIKPFIVSCLKKQKQFGTYDVVILLGAGKNQAIFRALNDELKLFSDILALEHPRYIMQYKRKNMQEYLDKYHATFKQALAMSQSK